MKDLCRWNLSDQLLMSWVLVVALCVAVVGPSLAQDPERPGGEGALSGEETPGPRDPEEVEAFLDGLMAGHLEAYDVGGATVAVVAGGELLFTKGYGYADVENKKKVVADRTLFRIGSVSKLFVWTAVMQLVEQGKLDLHADVNTYLADFKIPEAFGRPITVANLMSHTPGFEDHVIGLFAREADRLLPLGQLLAQELPTRVRPPGDVASYSNHGTALAGYLVEVVSGEPFAAYVEGHILEPLQMHRTTFRQPVPDHLIDDVSVGYRYEHGSFQEETFEYVPLAPAGAVSAAATDLASFMIAHLQNGRFGSTRILQEGTARQMHSELFRHAPGINAMAHGFYQMNRNGLWIIGHGGDTFWFHSLLALLPEHDVGFFVSYNSQGGGVVTLKFLDAFLDHYYPFPDARKLEPPERAQGSLERFAGSYRVNRYSFTTLAKLGAYQALRVQVADDGALVTHGTLLPDAPTVRRWIQTGPLLFRQEEAEETLAFRGDETGRITHMFVGDFPFFGFDRLAWFDTPGFHLTLLVTATLVFLSVGLWPIGGLLTRWKGTSPPSPAWPGPARWVAGALAVLYLVFLVGLAVLMSDPFEIVFAVPPLLKGVLVLPILAALLTFAAIAYTILAWTSDYGRLAGRLHYSLITLASLVALWQLNYWNLLGFHY